MEYEFIDIRQRQYIAFITALKRYQPEEWADIEDLPPEIYMDLLVRAAIEAGWFKEPGLTLEELGDMDPKEVDPIAIAVADVYISIKAPDPN